MTEQRFTAACVQMRSGRDPDRNVADAVALIREAAGRGARYVQTPENTSLMESDRERLFSLITGEDASAPLSTFRALADELDIWLHVGSLPIRVGESKAANRGFLISPAGEIAVRYDKIHMFDVDLPSGETYRESNSYQPGGCSMAADLPWATLGVSICYDLRFPALYRTLAKAGATVLTCPAAFTQVTGEAHWHVLLRARAIENGAFMVAAAQGGRHENGRSTYGHSLIVDPWGEILAEADAEPGIITAEIDMARVAEVRGRIPSLTHDRPFDQPPEIHGGPARLAS